MYLLLYEVLSLGHVCVTHMQCKFYPVTGIVFLTSHLYNPELA